MRYLLAALLLLSTTTHASERLSVIASFSVLADIVQQVAGEHADVRAMIGRDSDPHAFRASPASVRQLRKADLVVINGLGFEGWLERLFVGDGSQPLCVASAGVAARQAQTDDGHGHGPLDPHAWLSLGNAMRYIDNIATALIELDAKHAQDFRDNAARFKAELDTIKAEARSALAQVPAERRRALSDHLAFEYLGEEFDIRFIAARGVASGAEPSARDLAQLIRQVREAQVGALFLENIGDDRLLQQIAREAKVEIGGTLYAGALSAADGPAASYAQMMRHNLQTLAGAFSRHSDP